MGIELGRKRLLPTLLVAAVANAGAAGTQPLASAMDDLEQGLERARDALDQTRFDPDELVFELAFDAGEINVFVTTGIAYKPCDGLLRGIRGTLQSRSGNSLDQSVLLAYLPKSAGYETPRRQRL